MGDNSKKPTSDSIHQTPSARSFQSHSVGSFNSISTSAQQQQSLGSQPFGKPFSQTFNQTASFEPLSDHSFLSGPGLSGLSDVAFSPFGSIGRVPGTTSISTPIDSMSFRLPFSDSVPLGNLAGNNSLVGDLSHHLSDISINVHPQQPSSTHAFQAHGLGLDVGQSSQWSFHGVGSRGGAAAAGSFVSGGLPSTGFSQRFSPPSSRLLHDFPGVGSSTGSSTGSSPSTGAGVPSVGSSLSGNVFHHSTSLPPPPSHGLHHVPNASSMKVNFGESSSRLTQYNTSPVKAMSDNITIPKKTNPDALQLAMAFQLQKEAEGREMEKMKQYPGRISVFPEKTGSNANIKVSYSWPRKSNFRGVSVGLFRAGQATNDNSLISRRAEINGSKNYQSNILKGSMNFRSPRSCGKYEFRLYCIVSKNEAGEITDSVTVAVSNVLSVVVQGEELPEAVSFIRERMDKDDTLVSGLLQMSRIVEQLCDFNLTYLQSYFFDCLCYGHDKVVYYDHEDVRGRENVHSALKTLLITIEKNPNVHDCFTPTQKATIQKWKNQEYDKLCELFFVDEESRITYWNYLFKCKPWILLPNQISLRASQKLGQLMEVHLKSLIPSNNTFILPRIQLRDRLQAIVNQLPIKNIRVEVFGSSQNNFGSEDSDMDVCLVVPTPPLTSMPGSLTSGGSGGGGASGSASGSALSAREALEMLIQPLKEAQLEDVEGRLTARVPILLFKDPSTGIHCDICVNNPLALRNTRLLYAYSVADPRVRQLAYIIKKWAKARRMNNPSEGTLSTYGYLMMLISYLQRLPNPVVPILQSLHPMWDGSQAHQMERSEEMGLPSVPFPGMNGGGATHETYFYDPINESLLQKLRAYGARNTSSIGELLLGFFYEYAANFDFTASVVTIRTSRDMTKDEKMSEYGWRKNRRLSIEDPFELSYDVAHVLKDSRHKYIFGQFVRAYSLFASSDDLDEWNVEAILEVLWEPVVELPFAVPRQTTDVEDTLD